MADIRTFGAVRVFRNRAYRIYTQGNSISLIGTWVQRVATGWLVWELTHSGAWLGIIAAADLLPSIIMGPIGGAAADRMDRFRLIQIAQIIMAIQAFVLGFFTLAGWVDIWMLLALTIVHGVVVSLNQPARLSMVRSLVQPEDMPPAIAINSVLWNSARFVGPACAGLLIVSFDIGWAFIVNGVSYLAFIYTMHLLRNNVPRGSTGAGGPMLRQIAEGFAYVRRHHGIAPIIGLLFVGSIFARPFAELLPGFADAVFGLGAEGLAMLTSATGIGAVIGGLWLSQAAKFGRLTMLSIHSNLALSLALLLLCWTDSFAVGLIATALAGLCMTVNGVSTQSLLQYACEPAMLGRVLSIYGLSFRAGPALGALLMGAASEWFGLQIPVAVGALVCICAWAWVLRRQRAIAEAMGEASQSSERPKDIPA